MNLNSFRSVKNIIFTLGPTMLDLWYFFPSHLIPAEHTTQIHTVKSCVTLSFTVWIWVVCSAGIKWLGKKYQRSDIVCTKPHTLIYNHLKGLSCPDLCQRKGFVKVSILKSTIFIFFLNNSFKLDVNSVNMLSEKSLNRKLF